ncbi:hypothetical protein AB0O76_19205 [Streptomyces sp. NPDC086554]|uniref:hypothetical protein n=1 Tax=Streptomyces sp. NPDC086554 TaxID=3154864 RepID=UPI003423B1F4
MREQNLQEAEPGAGRRAQDDEVGVTQLGADLQVHPGEYQRRDLREFLDHRDKGAGAAPHCLGQ